jgi:hypothetical protein
LKHIWCEWEGNTFKCNLVCHFRRTAFKTEASKKQFGMNRPTKEWIYSTFIRRTKD